MARCARSRLRAARYGGRVGGQARERDCGLGPVDLHQDLAALGELHGVRDQVHEHLAQPDRVAPCVRRRGRREAAQDFEPLAVGGFGHQLGDILHQLAQIEVDRLQLHPAGFDLGEVQDVVDPPQQRLSGTVDGLHEPPLLVVELGLHQQLGHAEHAVHRGSDLMAHVGQELRLGPAGRFGVLLGLGQLRGARGDLLLQVLAMALQGRVARLDLAQHVVETVDQDADFVAVSRRGAKRVLSTDRHLLGHRGQVQQGLRDAAVSAARQQVRQQQRNHPDDPRSSDIPTQLPVPLPQAVNGLDLADGLLIEPDRRVHAQLARGKCVADRHRRRAVLAVRHQRGQGARVGDRGCEGIEAGPGEQREGLTLAVQDSGCQHIGLDAQRRQGLVCRFGVSERQCGGAVLADDLAERGHFPDDFVAQQEDLIAQHQRKKQQHRHAAGDELHHGELAADGQIAKRGLHWPSSRASRRTIFASFRS